MSKNNYVFTTPKRDHDLVYNPEPKIITFYQVCGFKHPKTNRYFVRKCMYDENFKLIHGTEAKYNDEQIKKFFDTHKQYEYKTYATYDLQIIGFPSGDDVLLSQSDLLNNDFVEYGYAKF
jgi:hypothetical protein